MQSTHSFCQFIKTPVGETGIVWSGEEPPKIVQIFLPHNMLRRLVFISYPKAEEKINGKTADTLRRLIQDWFVAKSPIASFYFDQDHLYPFQKRVLEASLAIPVGKVMTYGGLAAKLAAPKAARAVGTALARNPFPLVMPCHRIVRSDGSLGGFGGGTEMKRKLLEMEGITFDSKDRVRPEHIIN